MSILKDICPKCGAHYYGWSLTNIVEQKCEQCGNSLKISSDGVRMRSHYSSFTIKKYKIVSNHT